MRKKDYVEKATKTIVNRIKFHSPILYDSEIDVEILKSKGIDIDKPIFKFDKPINKMLLKAFDLAKRECDFNLVVPFENVERKYEKKLKNLKNVCIYSKYDSSQFLKNINKLNINYATSSNYDLKYKDKFFKINNQVLNPKFCNFSLIENTCIDDVIVEYKEFVLNGNNVFVKILNKTSQTKKIKCEINFPLKNGYYFIKKQSSNVRIENLRTKELIWLNFLFKNAKFSFSNVDGLENSVYCCVNIKIEVVLKAKQTTFLFFNLGQNCFSLKNLSAILDFCDLALKKTYEKFDVKVKTKNVKFDNYFNKILPQKIWLGWLNFENETHFEEKYLSYRKLFVKGKEKISFVPFKDIGIREIELFNGEKFKKIFIVSSDECFLQVGKTHFYGINTISNATLKSREPISLSFGV